MNSSEHLLSHLSEVETLINRVQQHPDEQLRQTIQHLTQVILEMHQHGFARILQQLEDGGEAGDALLQQLIQDPLISGLLVLHDLHPVDLSTRLANGISAAEDFLASHGASAAVFVDDDTAVRITITPAPQCCSSSATQLCEQVQQLIEAAAPDASDVRVELDSSLEGSSLHDSLLPIVDP